MLHFPIVTIIAAVLVAVIETVEVCIVIAEIILIFIDPIVPGIHRPRGIKALVSLQSCAAIA